MSTELGIARSKTEAIVNDNFPIYTGGIVIEDADKMTQYIRRPKVSIVRIEGELVLSK